MKIVNTTMLVIIALWMSFWSVGTIYKRSMGYKYEVEYISDDNHITDFEHISTYNGEIINARRANDGDGKMGYELIIKAPNW